MGLASLKIFLCVSFLIWTMGMAILARKISTVVSMKWDNINYKLYQSFLHEDEGKSGH